MVSSWGDVAAQVETLLFGIAIEDGGQLLPGDGGLGAEGAVGDAGDNAVVRSPGHGIGIVHVAVHVGEGAASGRGRGFHNTARSITIDRWFVQCRDTYRAPSGLTRKNLGCTTRQSAFYGEQEKQLRYLGFYPGTPDISTSYIFFVG